METHSPALLASPNQPHQLATLRDVLVILATPSPPVMACLCVTVDDVRIALGVPAHLSERLHQPARILPGNTS